VQQACLAACAAPADGGTCDNRCNTPSHATGDGSDEIGDFPFGLELSHCLGELVLGPLAIAVEFRQVFSGQFQDWPAFRGQYQLSGSLLSDAWASLASAAVLAGGHVENR